jgi:hypothetical protein
MDMCTDCAPLAIKAESLQRQADRLCLDLKEAERERAGFLATIARQREQLLSLAGQIERTP